MVNYLERSRKFQFVQAWEAYVAKGSLNSQEWPGANSGFYLFKSLHGCNHAVRTICVENSKVFSPCRATIDDRKR